MNDDRTQGTGDEREERGEAVIAADDTGMLSGERLITEAELVEGDPGLAGDV